MKKSPLFILILLVTISSMVLAPANVAGQVQTSDENDSDFQSERVYIPVVKYAGLYNLSGKVTNLAGQPVEGVSIIDQNGHQTTSNADGSYLLGGLPSGTYALAAEKEGLLFNPTVKEVELDSVGATYDFTALAACQEAIVNGGFETDKAWQLPVTEYTAAYTTAAAHSGSRSVRTGILNTADNRYSYSSARQLVNIPADTTSASLRVWLYPLSGEVLASANTLEGISPLAERPTSAEFETAAMAGDVQYVLVLDPGLNPEDPVDDKLIETLLWMRSDAQQWQVYNFDITKYAGRSIKIQVGTYNDGYGGISAMYADDISLELCDDGTPPTPIPPPTPTCDNHLQNSGFEYFTDWIIPITVYPAAYSTAMAHTGVQSMRTGIVNPAVNKYSYSSSYQFVTIPSNATQATLSMYLYQQSGEVATVKAPEELPPVPIGQVLDEQALSSDVQYVLVLNQYGTILESLVWELKNSSAWNSKAFNLLKYKGQTIRLHFGTYNNGYGGISSMYGDDIILDVCTTTPAPTPVPTPTPPPGTCTEAFANNGFETDSAWGIPITRYTAGYSTSQANAGLRSMRTGIEYTSHNRYSYSDAYQSASIPLSSTSATLEMYIFQKSGEPTPLSMADKPTTDLLISQASSGDVQYVLILDWYGNWIDTLFWQRMNTQTWNYYKFNLNRYIGNYVRIQFGTYNDGWGGVTTMYVDDTYLQVCP